MVMAFVTVRSYSFHSHCYVYGEVSWCECLPAVFGEDGFGQQVFVHKHHTRVIPHRELVVLDSAQDVSCVVPGQSVNHRP